jgi:predicted ATPase/DNA-binding SARP family transcriptional activator
MTDIRFAVLGPLEVQVGRESVPVPPGQQRRLLAALLLARGSVVTADRLVDTLWGEDPPSAARNALHTCVTRLRRTLAAAGDVVQHRPPGYRLDLGAARCDADEFTRLVERARAAATPDEALRSLDEALALWRGPAWGELAADVVHGDARRLEELRLAAAERRAGTLLRSGRAAEAVAALEAMLVECPLREDAVALLARAHCATGRSADALAALARHRRLLAHELGLDPSPDLVLLQERILRRELDVVPVAVAAPGSGAVAGPLAGHVPPPIPRHVSTLVGRATDADRLRAELAASSVVTVVGPGGVGKTRLAHHVVAHGASPVWWVDLTAVRDGTVLPQVVADVLGAEPFPGAAAVEVLRDVLARRDGVLVFDNCEHVVTPVAHLVADLVGRSRMTVLATSRERLGVEGEHVLVLPPLAVPDAAADLEVAADLEAAAATPSVVLFLDRARAADPELDVRPPLLRRAAQICRALDGLPLAIELAAARVGTFTVDDLADRLDARFELLTVAPRTAPAKHRTLRAVVDWSYDLLDPVEQTVFGRLAVFPGRFDLAAAEAVVGGGEVASAQVADVVARLVERSMVLRPGGSGTGRYRLLETLRQYAVARADPDDLARARRAHAAWAVDVAERAEQGVLGPDEAAWNRRLVELLPDLRAAFAVARRTRDGVLATRLTGALLPWAYWRLRTDVLDWGAQLIEDGLEGPRLVEAHAAGAAARWVEGQLIQARALAAEGVRRAGDTGEPGAGPALTVLGDARLCLGDLDGASAAYAASRRAGEAGGRHVAALTDRLNEAVAAAVAGRVPDEPVDAVVHAARALGNPSLVAFALYAEAEVVGDVDPDRAQRLLDEAIELAETVENRLVVGVARTAAVSLRGRHGTPDDDAFALFHRVVTHWSQAGTESLLLTALRNLVPLLVRAGVDEAAIELGAAVTRRDAAKPSFGPEAQRLAEAVTLARQRLGPARGAAAHERGEARSLDDATSAALVVLALLGRPAP